MYEYTHTSYTPQAFSDRVYGGTKSVIDEGVRTGQLHISQVEHICVSYVIHMCFICASHVYDSSIVCNE